MRATLNADRGIDHLEAHAEGKTVYNNDLRTEDVIHYNRAKCLAEASRDHVRDLVGAQQRGSRRRTPRLYRVA